MRDGKYVYKSGKWYFQERSGKLESLSSPTISQGKLLWPVPGRLKLSSEFGPRNGRHHDGIDIPAPKGTTIVAAASGDVTFSGSMRGYGKIVIINNGRYFYIYSHNSKNIARKGDKIKAGETIALIGRTGRASGNHLHFEIRDGKKALNPLKFY